jgi:RNA polymerase sigma-70 factor (ECF subfamily)
MGDFDPGSQTQQWLVAAKDGDAAAFAQLYEHLVPALTAWAEIRIRPAQRAHLEPVDLVQEVWLRAWRQLDAYDAERVPFRLWVFRVAKNVLLEAVRAASRRSRGQAGPSTRMFALANVPDEVTAVSKRMVRDESLDAFQQRLEALDEEERTLVVHCGLEGLPHKEVAERMGLSTEAVTKRWQRLRARLEEQGVAGTLLAEAG